MKRKIPIVQQLSNLANSLSQEINEDEVYNHIERCPYEIYPYLFKDLPVHASKYICNVLMPGMKVNCIFWRQSLEDAHTRITMAVLKKNHILFATEKTELFIINPFKIRRGNPFKIIERSINEYRDKGFDLKITDYVDPFEQESFTDIQDCSN